MAEITKSQKRHLKKVEKRKVKSQKRREEHEKHRLESGKLIKENTGNNYIYTKEFTEKAISWIFKKLGESKDSLGWTRQMREIIQELLIRWYPGTVKDEKYRFLKSIVDTYRDGDYRKLEELWNIGRKSFTGE